ncbi:MAG: hypothetical protein QOI78_9158 [Actinomycetota bacterium]|nr:hypothetical protein [Actinomycetota bacterium]
MAQGSFIETTLVGEGFGELGAYFAERGPGPQEITNGPSSPDDRIERNVRKRVKAPRTAVTGGLITGHRGRGSPRVSSSRAHPAVQDEPLSVNAIEAALVPVCEPVKPRLAVPPLGIVAFQLTLRALTWTPL